MTLSAGSREWQAQLAPKNLNSGARVSSFGLDESKPWHSLMHRRDLRLAVARLRAACEDRMIQQGKHSRGQSDSPPEKQAKQQRPYQSPCDSPHKTSAEFEQPQPSEREIAAANAARERLYSNKGGESGADVRPFNLDCAS